MALIVLIHCRFRTKIDQADLVSYSGFSREESGDAAWVRAQTCDLMKVSAETCETFFPARLVYVTLANTHWTRPHRSFATRKFNNWYTTFRKSNSGDGINRIKKSKNRESLL